MLKNLKSLFAIVCEVLYRRITYGKYNAHVLTIQRHNNRWYVEPENWPENDIMQRRYFELVNDAHDICERFSDGTDKFEVLAEYSHREKSLIYDDFSDTNFHTCVMYRKHKEFSTGALYDVIDNTNDNAEKMLEVYVAPCIMYVFGKYPKYIKVTRL